MKSKLILFILGLFIISCSDSLDDINNSKSYLTSSDNQVQSRSSNVQFANLDAVMSEFFNKDEATLNQIQSNIQTNIMNGIYSSKTEILEEFGVSEELASQFLSYDWEETLNENGNVLTSFLNSYMLYVCDSGTQINSLPALLSGGICDSFEIQGLFGWLCGDDPCNFCNTADAVVSSAVGLAVGCGSIVGCVAGTANAIENVVSYAQDCG